MDSFYDLDGCALNPTHRWLVVIASSDTGGEENGTADPFREQVVSLVVMTATGQADASGSWPPTR
jgi:hypothetical protein